MHTSTRRGFLAAGGAGLTASALAPRAAGATPPRACLRGPTGPGRGPVVAWLPDPASGQAYVLRGEQ
ncbi:hypothetical protein, partial [Intrasporangium sp.]|uniref:hypothetical protein n=1 Tax=Intrasporangium sp. TaxID=1925024 RepID=UPI003221C9D6